MGKMVYFEFFVVDKHKGYVSFVLKMSLGEKTERNAASIGIPT